jgi:hypothetical protein
MIQNLDITKFRAGINESLRHVLSSDNLDVIVVGTLLVVVFLMAVATIWRGRRRTAKLHTAPANASGFKRWLTPMGMQSIPAEQAVVVRPRRKSGSVKTIKVSTPVSKVPARALKRAGVDELELARKSGLARDAVAMMMANANPTAAAAAKNNLHAKTVAAAQTRAANAERAMTAPSAYGNQATRKQLANNESRGPVGTRLNARIG